MGDSYPGESLGDSEPSAAGLPSSSYMDDRPKPVGPRCPRTPAGFLRLEVGRLLLPYVLDKAVNE